MDSIGSRSFAVADPVTWNSLHTELRTLDLYAPSFAKRLNLTVIDCNLQRICYALCINICIINIFCIALVLNSEGRKNLKKLLR